MRLTFSQVNFSLQIPFVVPAGCVHGGDFLEEREEITLACVSVCEGKATKAR